MRKLISMFRRAARPAAMGACLALSVFACNSVADSRLFALKHIEVVAEDPALSPAVEQAVRRGLGEASVIGLDLEKIREAVQSVARVRAATIARVVPDTVRIRVEERRPAILVRRQSGSLVWLDADGIELGEFLEVKGLDDDGVPPPATGFAEGTRSQAALSENRDRIAVYQQIERELKEEPDPLWRLVDEIDLSLTRSISFRLANTPIKVMVGGKDFRSRLRQALQVIDAIRRGDRELPTRFRIQNLERLIENADRINFIDASRPDRFVLNFATPGTDRRSRQD